MDERERRRQRRYREAMRNRAIAAVFLAVLIVGIIFIVKGCRNKKQEQDQQQQQAAETLARQDDQQEPAAKPSAADNELLTLVNPWNPLPSDWEVDLVDLSNGSQIDRRCYDALQEMMDACRDAGYEPLICSAYRTQETQQELFDKKVAAFEAEGKSHDQAVQEAGTVVAVPGTSEHQLGLALDINADKSRCDNDTIYQWLSQNAYRYGFILRYPEGKEDITGIDYEPWHYRYVGQAIAQTCMDQGLTYEEYLAAQVQPGENQAPALFWQGQALDLGDKVTRLSGVTYVDASALAAALGWAGETGEDGVLRLSDGRHKIELPVGRRALLDGMTIRLSGPTVERGGGRCLPLSDLCPLLGVQTAVTDRGVELTPIQAAL